MDKKKVKYVTIRVKGITLITLVVTIIIMLILASITLTLILGDDGLLARAKKSTDLYKQAEENEQIQLNNLYAELASATSSGINIEEMSDLIGQIVDIKTNELQSKVNELQNQVNAKDTTPAGTVISYIAGTEAPDGYLKCDGTVYNISDYPSLAEAIKNGLKIYNYYGGDGTTTFAVPNLQGEFLRGYSTSSTASKYSGITTANVGGHQDATSYPMIGIYPQTSVALTIFSSPSYYVGSNPDYYLTGTALAYKNITSGYDIGTTYNRYGMAGRPTNTSVLYCIKY